MANLTESSIWEAGIYQLETTDPVKGGEDGISNLQGKQLANRTAYLKQQVELKAPLASPTFTGVPAVPTAAVDTNTTQAASTAFVQAQIVAGNLASKTSSGYQKLPSGLIIQWVVTGLLTTTTTNQSLPVTWPIAFPNNIFSAVTTPDQSGSMDGYVPSITNRSLTGCSVWYSFAGVAGALGQNTIIAIGC